MVRRTATLAVRPHRDHGRCGRLGRGDAGGACRGGRGRPRRGARPADRAGSGADRGCVADAPPARLLSRRAGAAVGDLGHRPGAVGHQGAQARRAGLPTARRAGTRSYPGVRVDRRRPACRCRAGGAAPPCAGLHRGEDERHRSGRLARQFQRGRRDRPPDRGGARHGHRRRRRFPRPRPSSARAHRASRDRVPSPTAGGAGPDWRWRR